MFRGQDDDGIEIGAATTRDVTLDNPAALCTQCGAHSRLLQSRPFLVSEEAIENKRLVLARRERR